MSYTYGITVVSGAITYDVQSTEPQLRKNHFDDYALAHKNERPNRSFELEKTEKTSTPDVVDTMATESPPYSKMLTDDPFTTPLTKSILNNKKALSSRSGTIVIVESDLNLRNVIRKILHDNYHVVECKNAEVAWAIVVEIMPDLVLSNIALDGMNGLQLCEKLKQDERTNHIPVILTNVGLKNNEMEWLKVQADHYITIPFDQQELTFKIQNLVRLKSLIVNKFSQPNDFLTRLPLHSGQVNDSFIDSLVSSIEAHMDDPALNVTMLSRTMGISRPVLYRKIKAITGMSINDFIKKVRLSKAADLLKSNLYNVNEVSDMVGFSHRRYFTQEFRKLAGKTPSEYARQEDS